MAVSSFFLAREDDVALDDADDDFAVAFLGVEGVVVLLPLPPVDRRVRLFWLLWEDSLGPVASSTSWTLEARFITGRSRRRDDHSSSNDF